ncbi:hypothetical protein VCHA57P527_110178 [Vibrio chagasii]|nr:hypothetical protein VCHA57P527_110178 [Vibrio chagasii]
MNRSHKDSQFCRKVWFYKLGFAQFRLNAIDYYLSSNSDEAAAKAFLNKVIGQHCVPEKAVIDDSKIYYVALLYSKLRLIAT